VSRGLNALMRKYQQMADDSDTMLRKFLLEMGLRALAKTKKRTPVQTGLLRNSWALGDQVNILTSRKVKRGKMKGETVHSPDAENSAQATLHSVKKNGDRLEITLYNTAEYATYVEYGHKRTAWGEDNGIAEGDWVEGRFMATVSIMEVEREMPAHLRRHLKEWLSKQGG